MKRSSDKDLIESVYTVALEPDRYEELTDIWKEHLVEALERDGTSIDTLDDDIQRGLRILESLTGEASTPTSRLEAFADMRFAVIAVNADGKILESNKAAMSAYGDLGGAELSSLPYDKGSIGALDKAVKAGLTDRNRATQMIRAVKTDNEGATLISVKAVKHIVGMEPYAFVQTSDFIWPEHLLPILEAAFGLTKAESSIIQLMTEGGSLAVIAQARSSSLATVRSQVRSIFEKTGTHSQTELVRMAIAFAALSDNLEADQTTRAQADTLETYDFEPAYPRDEDRYLLNLSDGRVLDYSIIGAPDGRPVIYTHCSFFGDVWTARAVKILKDKGLKMIAPSRAYYQRSSPCPPKVSPVDTYVRDVMELIAYLKLDRFLVLSRNIGATFGFELACQCPEKAFGFLSCAPSLPIKDESHYINAEQNHRFLTAAALHFPKLLELFVHAGQVYYTRVPPRKFVEKSFQTAKADFHLMDDPENMAAITKGLAHSGQNGAKAFLNSLKDVRKHTYRAVCESKIPIHLIIGEEDRSPRASLVKDLYNDGGIDKLIKVKGVAEFLKFAVPELVADAMVEMWEQYG